MQKNNVEKLSIPFKGKVSREQAEDAVRTLLSYIGEDPLREGIHQTPKRVVKSYEELYQGYQQNPIEVLSKTFEDVAGYDGMILLKDVGFESTCEHHMLPIVGSVHIAYIPNGRVVGISKLARVVEIYAKRLQIQEKMTAQIASTIEKALQPKGVAVAIKAKHFCMISRGVKKDSSTMDTSFFTGCFKDCMDYKKQFLDSIY